MDLSGWADVIKSAAQSVLGILALMILAVSLLALVFFREASERARLGIFVLLFGGAGLFAMSLLPMVGGAGPAAPKEMPQPPVKEAVSKGTPIEGQWFAEISYSWGVHEIEVFDFTIDGDQLLGTASFGKAPRQIVDGKLSKDRLHFNTILEDTDGGKSTYQYRGEIGDAQIAFTLDNEGTPPTKFIAARSVDEARRAAPRLPSGGKNPEISGIEAGPYDVEHITSMVTKIHPDVQQCYVETEFDPVDHAYMYYFVKIAGDGTVVETGAPGTDQRSAALDRCMDRAFRSVNWGTPGKKGDAEIKIGFSALPNWRVQ